MSIHINFPIYDTLILNAHDKDLTSIQKKWFFNQIPLLDEQGKTFVYVLIKLFAHHYPLLNCNWIVNTPNIDNQTNDLTYDLKLFPNKLKQLLYLFLQKHFQSTMVKDPIP